MAFGCAQINTKDVTTDKLIWMFSQSNEQEMFVTSKLKHFVLYIDGNVLQKETEEDHELVDTY